LAVVFGPADEGGSLSLLSFSPWGSLSLQRGKVYDAMCVRGVYEELYNVCTKGSREERPRACGGPEKGRSGVGSAVGLPAAASRKKTNQKNQHASTLQLQKKKNEITAPATL
jgi:hypothetical protein